MRFRLIAVAAVAALATAATVSAMASANVFGSVGPSFVIKFGPKKLKPGKYTFVINDKASIHNWHLQGPGVNKDLTTVAGTGQKRAAVTLKKGTYKFFCVPHASSMNGTFKVG